MRVSILQCTLPAQDGVVRSLHEFMICERSLQEFPSRDPLNKLPSFCTDTLAGKAVSRNSIELSELAIAVPISPTQDLDCRMFSAGRAANHQCASEINCPSCQNARTALDDEFYELRCIALREFPNREEQQKRIDDHFGVLAETAAFPQKKEIFQYVEALLLEAAQHGDSMSVESRE